jgi:hypothetical protein
LFGKIKENQVDKIEDFAKSSSTFKSFIVWDIFAKQTTPSIGCIFALEGLSLCVIIFSGSNISVHLIDEVE